MRFYLTQSEFATFGGMPFVNHALHDRTVHLLALLSTAVHTGLVMICVGLLPNNNEFQFV
jgi:hypothetical protein